MATERHVADSDRRWTALEWAAATPAALMFVPLLVPLTTGRVFAHMDLGVFHLPLRDLYATALAEGHSFVWTPQLFNGFYVHAEGQIGMLHPLHLLLYRTLPLGVAFNLELVGSYVFAFAGMWLLLRKFGMQRAARTIGAMTFTFSGFFLLHLGHMNAIAVAAHLPWLLLSLDAALVDEPERLNRRRRRIGVAGIALLTGSQVLLGYPQYVWMSALVCALYALNRAGQAGFWRRIWLPALAGVAGMLIGGVQLLPTLDLLRDSFRAAPTREFVLSFSLHPLNLVQLWSPYALASRVHAVEGSAFLHEFGLYNGAFSTLAVVWAISRWRQLPFRPTARFALLLFLAGLVLALGRYGFVYGQLAYLPLLGSFRAPARHLLLVHFGLALLSAIALEDILRSEGDGRSRRSGWLYVPVALSVLTLAVVMTARLADSYFASATLALTGLLLMAVTTLLVRNACRGLRLAVLALPAFVAADLAVWGYSYIWRDAPVTVDELRAAATGPPVAASTTSVHDETGDITSNYWLLRGTRIFRPYVGLYPSPQLTARNEATLRVAGVEWVRSVTGWRAVESPMPRARIVPEARISRDPRREIERTDVERSALVAGEIAGPLATPEQVNIEAVTDEPGLMEINVASTGRALLALTETYHEGWTASAAERTLPTLRINGDFLGVLLERGQYRVRLEFRPDSLRRGFYLTAMGLVATVVLAALADHRFGNRLTRRSSASGGPAR